MHEARDSVAPATARRGGGGGVRVRRRMTPDQLPLWRDVMSMQQQLRPAAIASIRAARRPAHPVRAVVALLLTVIVIVVWSVELKGARDLLQSRAISGFGARLSSLGALLTNERIAEAWVPITGALAAGAGTYVVLLLAPATRRFVRRHPVVPVALGAIALLGILQLAV